MQDVLNKRHLAQIKLFIIKEFQRLKVQESEQLEWHGKRMLTKLNYLIHTDAIKDNLIVPELTPQQKSFVYADEADLLNVALFGKTAKEWREENPKAKGNIRDFASISQLLVLANLESYNAILIDQEIEQGKRLEMLRKTAIKQLEQRERQIITLRYFKDMTQQQVAKTMGISQVQVSRIEKKVLQQIKQKMIEILFWMLSKKINFL